MMKNLKEYEDCETKLYIKPILYHFRVIVYIHLNI